MEDTVERATLGIGHDANKRMFWRFAAGPTNRRFWSVVERMPKSKDIEVDGDKVIARGKTAVLLADFLRASGVAVVNEGDEKGAVS